MKLTFVGIIILGMTTAAFAQVSPKPNRVDLLFEAHTSVPPFYQGKSLATPQATVRVTALPFIFSMSGRKLKPEELNFSWSKDLHSLPDASGAGKQTLTYLAESGGGNRISVTVSALGGAGRVEQTITIPVSAPRAVIYEDHPLTGISYHRAAGPEVILNEPEITFRAEAFYFSKTAAGGGLTYDWRLNGKKVVSDSFRPHLASFVIPGVGKRGENSIELDVKNLNNVLQRASHGLIIKFGQEGFGF